MFFFKLKSDTYFYLVLSYILHVNGDNVEDDAHQQVIQRIKAGGNETRMLVLDKAADEYYRGKGISVNNRMSSVKYMTTPDRSKCTC
jgi:hypothetical protein